MSFEPGLREVNKILQLRQIGDRKKLLAVLVLAILVVGVALAVMYYYRIGPWAGRPYTGAATLVLRARPASDLGVTADEYLGPVSYWVKNPADNTTIESGSITAADDWEVEVDIQAGHPGYVYVAMIPPNNTYYLYKPLSDTHVTIDGRTFYKIDITSSKETITAEFVKFGSIDIVSEGNVTFSASIFTTNILYNLSSEAALYNLTLKLTFNVSGLKIDSVTLNGSAVTWYLNDKDDDNAYDTDEYFYIWLSGKDFVINTKDKEVTYVLAITFSNASISSGQKIQADLTFFAYKFDKNNPFIEDEFIKVTLATDTALYTRA